MPEEITNLPREQTTTGKVKRNLHYWVAGVMAVLIVIVMVINTISDQKKAAKKPVASQLPPPPQLAQLRNTIAEQELQVSQKPPALPPALPSVPNPELPALPTDDNSKAKSDAAADEARRRAQEDAQLEIHRSAIMALTGNSSEQRAPATATSQADPMLLQQLMNAQRNNDTNNGPVLPPASRGKIADNAQAREDWQRQQGELAKKTPLHADPVSSPYTIYEGSILPAVLITQVNSEIPGIVTAQVTEDIYDGVNGKTLVIPQGTRLVGKYNTDVELGQERLQMYFHRLIYPSGASVELGRMPAADGKGQSGLQDQVNTHMLAMLTSSFALAKLAQVLQATHPGNGNPSIINFSGSSDTAALDPSGQIMLEAGRTLLDRYRTRPTTLVIRQGFRFNVMVARDMELPPPTTARKW